MSIRVLKGEVQKSTRMKQCLFMERREHLLLDLVNGTCQWNLCTVDIESLHLTTTLLSMSPIRTSLSHPTNAVHEVVELRGAWKRAR